MMKINLSQSDITELNKIETVRRRNFAVLDIYAKMTDEASCFITQEMMKEITDTYGLAEEDAFTLLFASGCGADANGSEDEQLYFHHYIQPSIQHLDESIYLNDDYYSNIKIPNETNGSWNFGTETYQPYEVFVCNDISLRDNFEEIPHLGYFSHSFTYPVVYQNGREWMAIKPNEIETMRSPIAKAHGKVITFGLGIGYYAYMVSNKAEAEKVSIVEKDNAVIELFKTYILPQFQHPEKIEIIKADAFDYIKNEMPKRNYDFAFADLWHDAGDGVELYLKLKALEQQSVCKEWGYWVEPTLLSYIRWQKWEQICDDIKKGQNKLSIGEIKDRLKNPI